MNKPEKSLRWVVNQIPDFKPTTNEEKMLVAIKLYSEAGAEEIKRLEVENAELKSSLTHATEECLKWHERAQNLLKDSGGSISGYEKKISDLQAENAALRERLEKAIILPCRIGDKFYVVNYYPPELNEEECCDFSFIELSKILLDNGCGVTYELGDNGCFFVTLDKNEAIRIYNQKEEEQND